MERAKWVWPYYREHQISHDPEKTQRGKSVVPIKHAAAQWIMGRILTGFSFLIIH